MSHDLNIRGVFFYFLENVSDFSLSVLSQLAIVYLVKDGQELISSYLLPFLSIDMMDTAVFDY